MIGDESTSPVTAPDDTPPEPPPGPADDGNADGSSEQDGAPQPENSPEPDATPDGTVKQRRRPANEAWVRPLAWVVAVAGLLITGAAGGQLLYPVTTVAGDVDLVVTTPTPTVAAAPVTMPDVLGLDVTVATRVLADAGIPVTPTTRTAPAAGPAGIVIAQDPPPGQADPDGVTLTLSEVAQVPEVVGMDAAAARAQLEALGAVVRVSRSVDPNQPEGLVLSSDPSPGADLTAVVNLVVTDPGQALTLAGLEMVEDSGCSTVSSASVNGTPVGDSIRCTPEPTTLAYAEWVLARRASSLHVTVGAADNADPGSGQVRVLGDGVVLADVGYAYGATTALQVDVRGVLRLRIEISSAAGKPRVILGDARVLGSADDLATIEAAQ